MRASPPDRVLVEYYTYLYDKVIALDFFAQFPRHALLDLRRRCGIAGRCWSRAGRCRARKLLQRFLGRSQSSEAFTEWIGEEFQAMSAATRMSRPTRVGAGSQPIR